VIEPSFEVIDSSAVSPIVLHVPHSSRRIPEEIRAALLLAGDELERELDEATDTLTDLLALRAVDLLGEVKPSLFINRKSRFVIDPERFPDDREPMNKVGMGAVYLKTTSGADLRPANFDTTGLLKSYFHPYAAAFTELVEKVLDAHDVAIIIDVHSYRAHQHLNAINHGQKRPAICVGTDAFHTPTWLRDHFFQEFGAIGECFENEPYAGTYVPLAHYGKDPRVLSIMMETRADTFLDDDLQPHDGFDRVATALSRVLLGIEGFHRE
jgi:N-formylglutamate deformylase